MYTVQYICLVGYDFIDKKTGKPVKGQTKKAVMTRSDGNNNIVSLEVVKVATDSKINIGDSGNTPLYDKWGRLYGFGG